MMDLKDGRATTEQRESTYDLESVTKPNTVTTHRLVSDSRMVELQKRLRELMSTVNDIEIENELKHNDHDGPKRVNKRDSF